MRPNAVKQRLQQGETVYGLFMRYPDPTLAEVMCLQNWDFVVFDAEHGVIEPRDCENMTRAAECRGVTPIVRVPNAAAHIILRFMDCGPAGLHVPWVNSAAEAEAVVQAVKYHPRGIRGLAAVRAGDFAQTGPIGDYVQQANEHTLIAIHIETRQAVEDIEAICEVPDVDVIFIGPTDLSHSYGVPGQPQQAEVQDAMQRVIRAAESSGRALGTMVTNLETAAQWRDRGARYITIGFESLVAPAMRDYLRRARES